MRLALVTVDRVMSNAFAVAKKVEQRCGYPASRITVIPNGVPECTLLGRKEKRLKTRQLLGVANGAVLIGSVGRLHEVKGFDVLIRAMAAIRADVSSAQLVIVGEGEQRKSLEKIAKQQNVSDSVHLVGHDDDVGHWLLAMDTYVSSSLSEGMSQAMAEAMAAGLPVVATDVGDASKMIRRETLVCGETCLPGKTAAIAETIARVISDTELRRHYSSNAVECHRRYYSESKFIDSFHSLFFETLGLPFESEKWSSSDPGNTADDSNLLAMRPNYSADKTSHQVSDSHTLASRSER